MSRTVRCGLIQAHNPLGPDHSMAKIKKAMIDKHLKLIEQAAKEKVQVLCLQELFYGPYFCAEQNQKWYEMTEPVPDGPTTKLMQKLAAKYKMVIVVPLYEEEMTGLYFNTAAVIDADGTYLGKYRKHHIPQVAPGFWEKFYFTPGDTGYLVFQTRYARVGVYICYDRHFPEGARILGLNSAEIVFNPSATVGSLNSRHMLSRTDTSLEQSIELELRSHGQLANSMARATSAILAVRSSRKPAATKTKSLWPILI